MCHTWGGGAVLQSKKWILQHDSQSIVLTFTLIPVLVASFTAANRLSYLGLNDTVNAQSMILPVKKRSKLIIMINILQSGVSLDRTKYL